MFGRRRPLERATRRAPVARLAGRWHRPSIRQNSRRAGPVVTIRLYIGRLSQRGGRGSARRGSGGGARREIARPPSTATHGTSAVPRTRRIAPAKEPWCDQEIEVVPGNLSTGSVSSRYLRFGGSQVPRRHRQLRFPPVLTGTPSRLTASARSVPCFDLQPPGTVLDVNVGERGGQTPRDQRISRPTCGSSNEEEVTRSLAPEARVLDRRRP